MEKMNTRIQVWVETEEEKWVNLSLCDLVEIVEENKRFVVQAWNGFQPNAPPHRIRTFDTREEALLFLRQILA
jgi:hypothetical protein